MAKQLRHIFLLQTKNMGSSETPNGLQQHFRQFHASAIHANYALLVSKSVVYAAIY